MSPKSQHPRVFVALAVAFVHEKLQKDTSKSESINYLTSTQQERMKETPRYEKVFETTPPPEKKKKTSASASGGEESAHF